jgi:NAD(P)-dependent dehydrogenase (short-subunit alcohol dehydrogenase family)
MGLSMTEYLLANGHSVVAAVRRPEAMKEHQAKYGAKILVVKVDVKNPEDIDAAFKEAEETFGRIDVVHNNAGYSAVGEVEAMPIDEGKTMFEVRASRHLCARFLTLVVQTNFWGATRVSIAAIKFFREVNKPIGGRLIQGSSIFGLVVCSNRHLSTYLRLTCNASPVVLQDTILQG